MKTTITGRSATVVLAVVAAFAITACGKSSVSSPLSPSSPSAPSSPAPSGGSAVISGSVSVASFSAAGLQVVVSGYGVGSSVGANGQFQIAQAPAGNLSLQFTGSNVNATVPIGQVAAGERVQVQIQLTSTSAGDVESAEHVSPDDRSEIEGRIASIDSSSRSLQVGSRTVSASNARVTSKGTAFDFSALKVQQHVHVSGSLQGNVVNAEQIEIEDAVEPEPGDQESEFAGSISALGGSCPALAMTIAGKSVSTSGATAFVNAACGDLKIGSNVEVKGQVQGNGSVLASRIQVDDNGQAQNEIEFAGSVASFGGSCPALTLGIAGKSVRTSASTLFDGISCGDVALGTGVEVKGIQQSDGSVAASRIRPQ